MCIPSKPERAPGEDGWRPTGVHEHQRVVPGVTALPNMGEHAGGGLAGVDRVEDHTLGACEQSGCFDRCLCRDAVAGTDETRPLQDLIALAFANRPDLSQAGVQVENTQISLQGSRNGLRPEVDLVGTAQNSALAAQLNPLLPPIESPLLGGYGNALEQLATRKYPSYGIGLNITLPLRNRIAQADVTRDEILLRQSQVLQEQLHKQAQLEVEDALIAMRRARASYDAAVETQKLQQESLDTEQAKFEVGASTSFFIIQYQSFLAQARSTVVVAKSAYLKARAALERATGTILDDNHVSLDDAIRGR